MKRKYRKFKEHLKTGGLFYAFARAVKYLIFLVKKYSRFFKASKADYISKGKIKIVISAGALSIFWNDSEITNGAGLNVAVSTLGLWSASTKADWHIIEKQKDCFKLKAVFRDLPITQTFILRIEDENKIYWRIDMDAEEWLHIDEFRIVCLIKPSYKSWICDYRQDDFGRPVPMWRDLFVGEEPASLVGTRFSLNGANFPSFVLEAKENKFFPFVQSSPLAENALTVGFRSNDYENGREYPSGHHHIFRGRITLFEEDNLLDDKIECLRRECLEKTVDEKINNKKQKTKFKVLLTNLPWHKDGKSGVRAGSRWPHIKDNSEAGYLPFPFFLAYATSLLRQNGLDASLIDAIAENMPEDNFLEKILGMEFDYLVAETSIPSFYYDLSLLKKISRAGIKVILCGPNSEIYQENFLKEHPFVSFVLCREYEFILLDLVQALKAGRDLSTVRGLIYSDNGAIRRNPESGPFDINLLPWPHRDDLPMHKYLDAPGEMLLPSVQMLASRGCPFKCQFCLWPHVIYNGSHYRARQVDDVVDEMEYLVGEKGFKSIYFDDDTFNIGKERMLKFCREIRIRGLDRIQWAIMARPDLMDEEILENMKKAGLWAVKYGVESADQGLVDSIGKRMDLRKTEKMIRLTQDLGIKTHLTFTFGLPGETKQSIEKTIKYALKLGPFSVQFSITTPFPGTQYYDALDKQGLIVSKDFSCYDGHFKSVIKLDNLSPEDLEAAKHKAYLIWGEHLKRNRKLKDNIRKFCGYSKDKGIGYAFNKTKKYFYQNSGL